MNKDINYYLNLRYKIEINPIPEEDGGGFEACIPQLGKWAFLGIGKTETEALKHLEEVKSDLFQDYLKKGIKIPKPEVELESYSGRILLRIPKYLHKCLSLQAKDNGISLNQYMNYLLSSNLNIEMIRKYVDENFQRVFYELHSHKVEFSIRWAEVYEKYLHFAAPLTKEEKATYQKEEVAA